MSTKVLVIPEDPLHNGYILQPIIERVLAEAGRPQARVTVLPRSKLNGIAHAKEAIRRELADVWRWMDLWIFVPDADRTSDKILATLEREVAKQGITLFGCAARPEVEAWLLAGHRKRIGIPWEEVAPHPEFKEQVFEPFLQAHGNPLAPGMGREQLTRETLGNYQALKQLCPEIARLEQRLRDHFAQS